MFKESKNFYIIAHRGASAYFPENTLLSFSKAIELNADMIELDIRKTRDEQLVVIHDQTVDRTTNGKGKVSSMTYDQIQKLDAGQGEKVPSLKDALYLGKGKTRFVIELKEPRCENETVRIIEEFGLLDDVFIASFDRKILKCVKAIEPRIKTALISFSSFNLIEKGLSLKTSAVAAYRYFVTSHLMNQAKLNKLFLFSWIVDDTNTCLKLKDMGIDGIVTNKPDILRKQ